MLSTLPAALGPVVAMGAEGEADLAGVEIAAFVLLRPDHDGPQRAVVGGRGEDFREPGPAVSSARVRLRGMGVSVGCAKGATLRTAR